MCRNSNREPYKLVELFSGIGAQRMGADLFGVPIEAVAVSEIDPHALRSYKAIYGDCPNLGDISAIESIPDCDILTYSFPCQSLSPAASGTDKPHGMAKGSGTASSLLWEVQRLLSRANTGGNLPEWLIMENVPAVHNKTNIHEFKKWVNYLSALGYTSNWSDLNAKDFGVPQNRKRCFMLSHLGSWCPQLPSGDSAGTVISDILEPSVDPKYFLSSARLAGLERSTQRNRAAGVGFRFSPLDKDRDVSRTVTTREGGRKTSTFIYDGGRLRRLTPREAWRLQGFPDWAFDRAEKVCSITELYKQAGNSIAVPVILSWRF